MKLVRYLVVLLLLVTFSWAEEAPQKKGRAPYEHRGLFFSAGLGLSYTGFSIYRESTYGEYTYEDYTGDGYIGWEEYSFLDDSYKEEFSGFTSPMQMEFRFGKSIANLFALYSIFDFGFYSGTAKYDRKDYQRPWEDKGNGAKTFADYDSLVNEITEKGSVYALSGMAGLGVSVYPFRNANHVMHGAYVGYSSGIAGIFTMSSRSDIEFGQVGVYTQFELGKDWWVSETWSIGCALAYSFVTVIEDDYYSVYNGDRDTIKLLFRLTRG